MYCTVLYTWWERGKRERNHASVCCCCHRFTLGLCTWHRVGVFLQIHDNWWTRLCLSRCRGTCDQSYLFNLIKKKKWNYVWGRLNWIDLLMKWLICCWYPSFAIVNALCCSCVKTCPSPNLPKSKSGSWGITWLMAAITSRPSNRSLLS